MKKYPHQNQPIKKFTHASSAKMHRKVYSSADRVMDSVPYPPTHRLTIKDIFGTSEKPNLSLLLRHLEAEGRLELDAALTIMIRARELTAREPNLIEIGTPVTIVGDIHGQFFDMLKMFEKGGDVASNRYLFLGDYVDRGQFSVEVVLYLWAIKISYPDTFFLLRGNHECRNLTVYFTFKDECLLKLGDIFYEECMKSFDCLPIAALVQGQLFCIHGCISPEIRYIREIADINRTIEPPTKGPLCDILWADPVDGYDNEKLEQRSEMYTHNGPRGCSYNVSYKAMCKFLDDNDLLCVIRAHQVQSAGCKMYKKHEKTLFPTLVTIFSAPNYCEVYKNRGAILRYDGSVMHVFQYKWVKHPYVLPNFLDAFRWSIPFVLEKVTEMLLAILKYCSDENDIRLSRRTQIIEKIVHYYASLSDEAEQSLVLGNVLPPTTTHINQAHIVSKDQIDFQTAQRMDYPNEHLPYNQHRLK
ncbi:unnamed protein product [Rotaria socialis]|uniref:Serine/threonine-protein phosphatase n=4 Tax=Rotaria socialis TaxID=392032 RepID=A0A818YZ93_9BILA|nr:unnamed protein product [Rotaria socialis]CAF3454772.1 unnamed protein product [Rotaria socialis]CAF3587268.1 unnamed protein product [Rotaria socialis]CAF3761453.1 unnamed protein product [Rotaria socialis]CAF4345420.1 unnamed protein product [Rotaria socialis]